MPERIRTPDLFIRSEPLYPAELRARCLARATMIRPHSRATQVKLLWREKRTRASGCLVQYTPVGYFAVRSCFAKSSGAMPRVSSSVSNWSGNQRWTPHVLAWPRTEAEVQALVRQAAREGRTVRAIGAGHSFSALCPTEGYTVSLGDMTGLVRVEGERGDPAGRYDAPRGERTAGRARAGVRKPRRHRRAGSRWRDCNGDARDGPELR